MLPAVCVGWHLVRFAEQGQSIRVHLASDVHARELRAKHLDLVRKGLLTLLRRLKRDRTRGRLGAAWLGQVLAAVLWRLNSNRSADGIEVC